jgi:transposase
VAAARQSTSPKVALGSRPVPELEAEVTKLRKELAMLVGPYEKKA